MQPDDDVLNEFELEGDAMRGTANLCHFRGRCNWERHYNGETLTGAIKAAREHAAECDGQRHDP